MQDPSKLSPRRGFTLVEILITMALITLTVAMALPTMAFLMQSNYVLGNATGLTKQSRQFVDEFGFDLRSTVSLSEAAANRIVITVEDPESNQETITYAFDSGAGLVTKTVGSGSPVMLLSNVVGFEFGFFDSKNVTSANYLEIKKIEVKMELKESVLSRDQKLLHKSARFILRNRATQDVI